MPSKQPASYTTMFARHNQKPSYEYTWSVSKDSLNQGKLSITEQYLSRSLFYGKAAPASLSIPLDKESCASLMQDLQNLYGMLPDTHMTTPSNKPPLPSARNE